MKLITSLTSPFGRKIRILLQEKNIPCQTVEDIPWNVGTVTPDYNPLGKVRSGLSEAQTLLHGNTCTGSFSLADIALISTLSYVQFRLGEDLSLHNYPRLDAFCTNMQSRVSVTSTNPAT